MLSSRSIFTSALLFMMVTPGFAYMHARRGPTSTGLFKKRSSSSRPAPHSAGPRVMDSDRATEIQTALIKSGYMTGTPSGHWDSASEVAMQKLQGSNGWQTKLTPDSRALILLGLGPNQAAKQDQSLNPQRSESMTASIQTVSMTAEQK